MKRRLTEALRAVLEHLPWLVAAVILAVTVRLVPAFGRADYWGLLSGQYVEVAVLALALTPVVLTGGIDLSVGSVTVFTSIVIGVLIRDGHWPVGWALAAGVAAGLLAGLLNGSLVVLGVVPLVATLATRETFRGLAFSVGGEAGVPRLPGALQDFWEAPVLGLPLSAALIGVLFVLAYVIVHHTWVGRMVYAVGDNEVAARFAGVPVRRLKLGLYAAAGLLAGVCGSAVVLRDGAAKADAGKALELMAITCVVLGGVRITGGSGHVAGALLGTVTVVTLTAALNVSLANQLANRRDMVLGGLLIAVAVCNEAARRWAARQ